MKTTSRLIAALAALLLSLFAFSALAQDSQASEPTLAQIYQAANTGQLDRADRMIEQVLQLHPNSAKAHYVKSELAAREHKFDVARQELATAERIAPGLPFAKPESVQALRNQLSASRAGPAPSTAPARQMGYGTDTQASGGLPWGTIALVALIAIVAIAFMRRRRAPGTGYGGAYGNSSAAPYGQTGDGPVYPPGAGAPQGPGYGPPSMGSSIMRGLGAGLAVGAGAVAAEEIGRRMFPHGSQDGSAATGAGTPPSLDAIDEGMRRNLNTDMGGDDFGIADGGWDDPGGGGGGGGGDWDT